MAEKVVRSSLVDQVHSFIIKRIQRREILPGDRLNIEELAKEFGVSRTPVREAISRLTQEGFVVQNHNAGPCVADFGKEQGLDIIIANAKLFDCVFQMMPGEAEVDSMVAELEEIIQQQEETLIPPRSTVHLCSSMWPLSNAVPMPRCDSSHCRPNTG